MTKRTIYHDDKTHYVMMTKHTVCHDDKTHCMSWWQNTLYVMMTKNTICHDDKYLNCVNIILIFIISCTLSARLYSYFTKFMTIYLFIFTAVTGVHLVEIILCFNYTR